MLMEPTVEKLKILHLYAMAAAWVAQRGDPSFGELDFDARLALLVDAETLARDNKRIARLLREAKLRIPGACVEDIDTSPKREIERSLVRTLATGRWIADHQNVLITGMTGVGKTYVACALAQLGCRMGFRALYRRTPRLFEELALAHVARTRACSASWRRSTCSCSTTGASRRSPTSSDATCSRSWTTDTARSPPSSRASSPSESGMTT